MKKFQASVHIFFTFLYIVIGMMNNAYAADAQVSPNTKNAIEKVLCNIVDQLTGGIGKGIATIAIIALAIGLFLGKLSWGLAIATALGIGMVFGAKTVVTFLSAGVGDDVSGDPATMDICK